MLINLIQKKTKLPLVSVQNTVALLKEGATIPFIARYRKERTGSLDENQIAHIQKTYQSIQDLIKRKEYVLKVIEEQGNLNTKLRQQINNTWEYNALEDLYLPYKRKATTKASMAIANGLEPLAKKIMQQNNTSLYKIAESYRNTKVKTVDNAIIGAKHIIAAWISESQYVRNQIRKIYSTSAIVSTKVVTKKKADAIKYKDYFEFSESLGGCPSHRLLAIYRGEKAGYLRVKITVDNAQVAPILDKKYVNSKGECANHIKEAIDDSLKRLIYPSIENEYRKLSKHKADIEAINVFSENLKQLLLAAPLGSKPIIAIDPGFRSGCKVVCLNENGGLLYDTVIYPHPPQMRVEDAKDKIYKLTKKYKSEAIAIGNGSAGKETMVLCKSIEFENKIDIHLVNESGASIYSASKVAQEEFPTQDLTVRGSVSIGRRLMDPLAELVKIDPKSIGIGQYQHDVDQNLLKESLDRTVESSVNAVGINLNTASKHLLTYVSGLGPTLAENVVKYRTENGAFYDRKQLKKVARMGTKSFEQAAGFLRIRDGKNVLDTTAVHPESYPIVKQMALDAKIKIANLLHNESVLSSIDLNRYVTAKIGIPTLKDIITGLAKPEIDIRGEAEAMHFSEGINSIADLSIGMVIPGVINNITKFGAFVDIGIKESGLVHISQITNKFIKDPAEVLKLNQQVKVKVMDVDEARKRISLSMKNA